MGRRALDLATFVWALRLPLLLLASGVSRGHDQQVVACAGCFEQGGPEGLGLLQRAQGRKAPSVQGEADTLAAASHVGPVVESHQKQPPTPHGFAGPKVRRRFAFVTMSHTAPGEEEQTIWGVLAIAVALRRVSRYPLVVLTNGTQFSDGTSYAEAFRKLRVQMLPVYPLELTSEQKAGLVVPKFQYAWWKVQIWNLTQFDKLIWLDSDTIPTRSVDWLFERDGVWGQPDIPHCTGAPRGVCAGVLLMQPDAGDFRGLLAYAKQNATYMPEAEQTVIPNYFAQVKGRPVSLLRTEDAHLGWCVGSGPTPFRDGFGNEPTGVWNLPAIVHKSGGPYSLMCFLPKLAGQLRAVGNATINLCHYNPVGIYWRDMFCEAAHGVVGLNIAEVLSFCNDACWWGFGGGAVVEDLRRRLGPDVVCTPHATTDPASEETLKQAELAMEARPLEVSS